MNPSFRDRVRQWFARDAEPNNAGNSGSASGCSPVAPYAASVFGDCCGPFVGGGITNQFTGMGTPRDQTTQTFYNFPRLFSKVELENAYRSSWIAKRIVNLPANDMVREWRQFSIEGDVGNDYTTTLENTERALQVKKRCNTALKWARLYGGAIMFLGIGDEPTEEPLDVSRIKKGDLKWLLVLDRHHVNNLQWQWAGLDKDQFNYDLASPQFGTPLYYYIMGTEKRWHYSRVIRFDGEELPLDIWQQNGRWNDSALNHVLQSVLGLESAQHACLLAMQQGSLDVVSFGGISQLIKENANAMQAIYNRVRVFSDLKSTYRVAVKDTEDKLERVAAALGGYDNLFERFQDEMCGAAEIPHTVLYGQTPSGLQSTGQYDTRQYYDSISTKQENDLRPPLDYLDQVLVRSALGEFPDTYSFDFKPLWQIDDDVRSQIELRRAQRDDIYVKNGVLEPEMVTEQLLSDGIYSTLTKEDLDLIESYNEPMDTGRGTSSLESTTREDIAPPGVLPPAATKQLEQRTLSARNAPRSTTLTR